MSKVSHLFLETICIKNIKKIISPSVTYLKTYVIIKIDIETSVIINHNPNTRFNEMKSLFVQIGHSVYYYYIIFVTLDKS